MIKVGTQSKVYYNFVIKESPSRTFDFPNAWQLQNECKSLTKSTYLATRIKPQLN